MSEPTYISQTFEPEHVANQDAVFQWFQDRGNEAKARGCTWPRYSKSESGDGLLFEAWTERPRHEGDQRWSHTLMEDR